MNSNPEPTIQDVLPVATQEAITTGLNEAFKSTLKLPKGMSRYMAARAVDLILLSGYSSEGLKRAGYTKGEVSYAQAVAAEFKVWEVAQRPQPTEER